ncbi:putative disease resistance protein RGA3 [Vigna radiata var. radiata]|uniref:Disease resistance protein RGA3 n=1 Tax=Vigna radiata var. radiata TaxID=3916 RepID=A0A1S3UZM0_VIGRR|nr:putative disease resistance protein RGA3 [Vigna radiata var. radiata]
MAESLLFGFAESLLRKLATAAVQEASLGLGVDRQLQQMKATTALIKAVLLDAEQKNPHSSALSEWLVQVKHMFSEAEDIVDDFECEALRKHVVNTYGGSSRKVRRSCEMGGCPALSKRFHPIIGYDWHRISHVKKVYIGRSL